MDYEQVDTDFSKASFLEKREKKKKKKNLVLFVHLHQKA